MDDRKCICGHANPVGTQLCEACGRPLEELEEKTTEHAAVSFPDMRYEGTARRSQTYTSTIIDRVWNFFSSVKIAIWIIVVTLIASAVGTIFPQKQYIPVPVPQEADVARFYETTYGVFGKIYYTLGFHQMYSSWWFVTLLVMLGTSLVICSLDRVIPLYKALKKPRLNQHESFLRGQKLHGEWESSSEVDREQAFGKATEFLKAKGYRTYREGDSLLAEKSRFSRWGPYINHIGLIIFLAAVLMRSVPGFYLDEFVWVREGQTVALKGTPYYLKNEGYKTEYYSEEEMARQKLDLKGKVIAKNFQTDAVLYENKNADLPGAKPELQEIARGPIVVNHPMVYGDVYLYQTGKQENMLGALNFVLVDRQAGNKELGTFKIDLYDPAPRVDVGDGYTVHVLDYFPDFFMDQNGKPATRTSIPNNPMIAFEIKADKLGVSEKMVYVSGSVITQAEDSRLTLDFHKPDLIDISGLMIRKDKALPYIYFGSIVFMIGVVMGTYWQHRRIWIQWNGDRLHVAAHTNKNWFGLRREVDGVVSKLELPIKVEQKQKDKR